MGLELKAAKTRILKLEVGGEGLASAFITGWCEPGDAKGPNVSPSWPDGPHVEPSSTPGRGSVNSRTAPGCWSRSNKSSQK